MGVKKSIQQNIGYAFVPIGQAFEEFLDEKEAKNLAASTIRNYRQSYEYFMKFTGLTEDDDCNEVKPQHFHKWMNTMKLEGVKHTSVNHYLRDCRTFFYWCMDADRMYINNRFKISMAEGQEEALKLFSDEEVEALLIKPARNAKFVDWRTWAIVNWVLATGNRSATICEVKLGDIDYTHKEIVLNHTKNKKAQTVPLSTSLNTVLKEYVRMWRSVKDDIGTKTSADEYLFCDISQSKLTTNALRHSFAKYCESRGVKHTNIHGLRHNFAKMWIMNNGSMAKLQRILGHSSLEMTRRYVKIFGEDLKDDFDKFSPLDTIKRNTKRTQTITRRF